MRGIGELVNGNHQLANSPIANSAWCFQDFVDEEQIGEQRAQVDRRVEVVDDLRADRRLREHQLNRGLRVARVALDDRDERVVRRRRLQALLLDVAREDAGEPAQRRVAALAGTRGPGGRCRCPDREERPWEAYASMNSYASSMVSMRALSSASGLAPALTPGPPACALPTARCPTGQRLGSWCSRYCRRVIQPRIIDLVIHHFSGRTAK